MRHVRYAKPNPDLFLTAAERVSVPVVFVVGDSIWDVLAATRAGAPSRVFDDPEGLRIGPFELGVRV